MPELPEVETITKTLRTLIKNETIEHVEVYWSNIIKYPSVEQFTDALRGQTFYDVKRLGKFLLFTLDDYVLVSHLRMEGKYSVDSKDEPMKKHTHVIFEYSSGKQLRYNDVRKFGTMHLFEKGTELENKPLNQLGPDPFEEAFTYEYFHEKLQRTTRPIKNVLLDQTVVAGLGNIYVDETLYLAHVHPLRRAHTLEEEEVRRIQKEAIKVLKKAVKQGGTTIRSYVDSSGEMGMFQQELYVYGQEDTPCATCGSIISKIKVSGRGTHFCSSCQPEDRSIVG